MRVTLFRDHPAESWPSMDRHATALYNALQAVVPDGWEIVMPMPPAPPQMNSYCQMLNRIIRYPLWARNQSGDINHILDHSYAHLLYMLDPQRTLVTVHDVAPLHFPNRRLSLSNLCWIIAWYGLKRARQIVTVSRFTASEIHVHLQDETVKTYIVPNGVEETFRPQSQEVLCRTRNRYRDLGEHLLLHVGHTHARKNLGTLIRAVKTLRSRGLQVGLIQVGGRPSKEIFKFIADERELSGCIRFLGLLDDVELIALYGAVDVFVFPSLYEGFGLPVLEAMACGTPVVASNVASLPEVVDDAGFLVDPMDVNALADAIQKLLTDVELREDLRRRGLMRAKEFSWQRCAQATLAVYQQMIG